MRPVWNPELTALNNALQNLKSAYDFFEKVKKSSIDEKISVGTDHYDWLISSVKEVVESLDET